MDIGDFVSCQYEYDDTETGKNYVPVLEGYIYYLFFKNCTATNESLSWFHIIQGFIIKIYRPNFIVDYNHNMGGLYWIHEENTL